MAEAMGLLVGVDIGGTFTDVVVLTDDGKWYVHKALSTPPDFERGVADALSGLPLPEGFVMVHGTTIATNAVLERKGAKTALITTDGFRDILEIGRQTRPKLYALCVERPEPLVPRERRFTVPERIAHDGTVLTPLELRDAGKMVHEAKDIGAEALAICLLFSFANPQHEQMLAKLARKERWFVSVSHEVLPEFREYERTATTVLNAYVGPLMNGYLKRLQSVVRKFSGKRLWVTQSSGGSVAPSFVRKFPIHTLYSGPAAGVIGASFIAGQVGFKRILTFDMGGTSTDVALCFGEPVITTENDIGGLPLRIPSIAVKSIGAGGGSIAWLDEGGALRVGPQSAGANPGPACYGFGGQEPTVTDANLLLGRLDPNRFWGGRLTLRSDLAQEAVKRLAEAMETSLLEASEGIVAVANANMARALLAISAERGYDPRDFALFSFGGAGGLHACLLAEFLDIRTVLLPPFAGALSALGAVVMDADRNHAQTVAVPLDEDGLTKAKRTAQRLAQRGRWELRQMGFSDERIIVSVALDLRYQGQGYELTVPLTEWQPKAVRAVFEALHRHRFGHIYPETPIDIVTVRVQAKGLRDKPKLPLLPKRRFAKPSGTVRLWVGDGWEDAPLWERKRLGASMFLTGPCLLVDAHATAYLPPNWKAKVDKTGCVIANRAGVSSRAN